MPAAATSISTSPAFGSGMGRVPGFSTSGPPGEDISIAVIVSATSSSRIRRRAAAVQPFLAAHGAQDEAVAAPLVGGEPFKEGHAEQVLAQHARARDERRHAMQRD